MQATGMPVLRARTALGGFLGMCGLIVFSAGSVAQASQPVLGSKQYGPPPFGKGYGSFRPRTVHHGGAAAGYMFKISWRGWGSRAATGKGKGYGYKPGGGYYKRPIKVKLRASRLGYCGDSDRRAYTVLKIKKQRKPGGSFYPWSGPLRICG